MEAEREQGTLWTYDFTALWFGSLVCFCNMAIFYGFYNHLEQIGIAPAARGPLLALEPITALVLRPYLSGALHLRNSVRVMLSGLVIMTGALCCYPFAASVPVIAAVRVLHGLGYVLMASALMTAFTHILPKTRVAQGFGLLSIAALLPTGLMPPFVEAVTPLLPGSGWAYAMATPLMLAALALLWPLGRRLARLAETLAEDEIGKPSWSVVLRGLAAPGVTPLLLSYLLLLLGHTIVYFFMKSWALNLGAANPGLFFACANLTIIALRVGALSSLDRLNPGLSVGVGMTALGLLVPSFGLAGSHAALLAMAVLYGCCLGVNMPLLNAAMYRVSQPNLRAANTNLLFFAMDAGFILGPLLASWLLAGGMGLRGLFAVAGGAILLGGAIAMPVRKLTPAPPPGQAGS